MARHSPAVTPFSTLHLVFFKAVLGLPTLIVLAFALGETQRAWQVRQSEDGWGLGLG